MINIAVALDDRFLMPVSVLINSIGFNNKHGNNIKIYAFSLPALRDESRIVLLNECKKYNILIDFIKCDIPNVEQLEKLVSGRWSVAVFIRLFIPDLLPNINKILFLDGDIIVRHDLKELYEIDLKENAVAAVYDAAAPHPCFLMKYDDSFGYFNAGMLLINCDYHRKHKMSNIYLDFLRINKDNLRFLDQDILNNVLFQKKLIVHPKFNFHYANYFYKDKNYNYYDRRSVVLEAYDNPTIVHFTNDIKPWHKYCPNPYTLEWNKYLKMSIFRGYKKDVKRSDKVTIIKHFISMLCGFFHLQRYI